MVGNAYENTSVRPCTSDYPSQDLPSRVVREHDPKGRDVELFRRHLYADGQPKLTSKGSKGAELVDGLFIKDEDYKVVKTQFSAFFATHLHSVLQGAGIDSLVVVGVQTPNCIRHTVFDAVELDYKSVTVFVDATAAATPDIHAVSNTIIDHGHFVECYENAIRVSAVLRNEGLCFPFQ
ncbi:probable inactive nicotinamidase isoform X1 [Tanacetum coccineum]